MKVNLSHVLIWSSLILLYPLIVFDSYNYYNAYNFIIYSVSLFFLLLSVSSIRNNGVRSYNILSFFYLFALFINTLNVSDKQLERELVDLYIFYTPLMVPFLVLYISDRKMKRLKLSVPIRLNITFFYITLILMYVALRLYIGHNVGYRLFSYDDTTIIPEGEMFVIPGFSGLAITIQWMLLIFSPYVKRKYIAMAVVSIIIFSVILHVKRGDFIRLAAFFSIQWLYLNYSKITLKKAVYISVGLLFFVALFTIFGEWRLSARGGEPGLIVEYLGSRVNSVFIAWIYGYLSFNFEILKLYFSPEMLLCKKDGIWSLIAQSCPIVVSEQNISGFNAGTYASAFARDFGSFMPVVMLFHSLMIAIFLCISRCLRFFGLYIFSLVLCSLMVFGDYWSNNSLIVACLLSSIIFPFLKLNKKVV